MAEDPNIRKSCKKVQDELNNILISIGASDGLSHVIGDEISESDLAMIEQTLRKIVIGQVIIHHLWIEQMLDDVIVQYFIPKRIEFYERKMEIFKTKVLSNMEFRKKLNVAYDIVEFPRNIKSNIEAITSTRNDLAHCLSEKDFKWTKGKYKSNDMFTVEAMEAVITDYMRVQSFLSNLVPLG